MSVLILGMDSLGWLKPVKLVAERQLIPVERMVGQVVMVAMWPMRAIGYYNSGLARIADLEARLAEKTVEAVMVGRLREENEQMRAVLESSVPASWKLTPARVVGRVEGKLVVEGGNNLGLVEGQSVVSGQLMIGRVSKVSEAIAEIVPITAEQSLVAARVAGKEVSGIIKGNGDKLELTRVQQGVGVEAGDVVESSGTDGVIPGLVIGRVVAVGGEKSQVYQIIEVQPMIEIGDLGNVFVIGGI